MNKQNVWDVVIIGGGPAGIYALINAKLHNLKALLIESNGFLGGQPVKEYGWKAVYDFPGNAELLGSEVAKQLTAQLNYWILKDNRQSIDVLLNTTVTKIEEVQLNELNLTLSDNSQILTRKLLLSVGNNNSYPIQLDTATDNSILVQYQVIDPEKYIGKDVIILGGGDSAVDWALNLASIAKSITLIHRRTEWRAKQNSIEMLTKAPVNVLTNYEVVAIKQKYMSIKNNASLEEQQINGDICIVQFGNKFSPIKIEGLNVSYINNKVVVNSTNLSSHPHIYAAGNCCLYEGKVNSLVVAMAESVKAINDIYLKLNPLANPSWYSSQTIDKK